MICNSNSWSRGERRGGGVAGRERGEVMLGMASQIDHFGSFEEYVSAC